MSSSQDNATSERVCAVPVRIINPVKKKDYQVFTLRCVKNEITTPEGLRKALLSHFGKELIPDATNFDIGYLKGQQKLWIRSEDGAWEYISKGTGSFWCVGINKTEKKRSTSNNESDTDGNDEPLFKMTHSSAKSKVEKVEYIKLQLSEKHGTDYSPLQYRLWAEMIVRIHNYSSMDLPPRVPMFTGINKSQFQTQNDLTITFTTMAEAVTAALKPTSKQLPQVSTMTTGCASSPRKLADLRSTSN